MQQQTRLTSWAERLFIVGLVLGLVFIIPSVWFPQQLGKIALTSIFMLVSTIFFVWSGGMRVLLRDRSAYVLGAFALIPGAYLLSYLFSIDRSVGMSGFSVETDTLLFSVLSLGAFALSLGLFRTMKSVRTLLLAIGGSTIFVSVVQYIAIISGTSILPAVFTDRSVNLIGKWNDLGLTAGLLVVLALVALEFGDLSFRKKVVLGGVTALAVLLLTFVNFPLVWFFILGFSIVLGLWSFVNKRSADAGGSYENLIPWIQVGSAVVSLTLLLWGSVVNTGVTSVFPVSALEVRPSFTSTLNIIKAAHGSSFEQFLVGTGPQTFGEEWLLYKPASVNQSVFWNFDFNVGYSTLLTALGTVGLIGVFAWIFPLLLVVLALVYAVRSTHFSQRETLFATYLGVGAVYTWSSLFFYVPSQSLIILSFVFAGALLGFVLHKRVPHTEMRSLGRAEQGALALAGVVMILLLSWSTYSVTKRYIADAYTNQGLLALQQGQVDQAIVFGTKSIGIEKNNNNLRLVVDAGLTKLQQIAGNAQTATPSQIAEFAAQAQKTIPAGQQAVQLNPKDYRTYLSLGRIYDFLTGLGVSGGYENAKVMYQSAEVHSPMNPQIPLLLARLEAAHGNMPGVQSELSKSLTLKPDYTDAILFVVQLNVAQKDIPNAIHAAQAAVQSAPGVAPIWFQLGLLYYAAGSYADAVQPLEQAIKLQSDYANAKYFLGLAYAAQGRNQDAIQQFTDLQKTNPDNQEVALILKNLSEGRAPFANAKPPITDKPQTRSTAPIGR